MSGNDNYLISGLINKSWILVFIAIFMILINERVALVNFFSKEKKDFMIIHSLLKKMMFVAGGVLIVQFSFVFYNWTLWFLNSEKFIISNFEWESVIDTLGALGFVISGLLLIVSAGIFKWLITASKIGVLATIIGIIWIALLV